MLKSLDFLVESFGDLAKKSRKECKDELEKIRSLAFAIIPPFFDATSGDIKLNISKYYNSLVYASYLELHRISGRILFLSCNGLYRNAFDEIRYTLELVVQALYIDQRHSETDIATKIEILKEVEDKRDYHSGRLIDDLDIANKNRLKKEYKRLSQIIHPSNKQTIATYKAVAEIAQFDGIPITVDCEEVAKIFQSMKEMFDIFFYLFLSRFPETGKLRQNKEFIKEIKTYDMTLLCSTLKV